MELLVLGDTQIVTPHSLLIDDRIGAVAGAEREAYRARLASGRGYDAEHRVLLQNLQAEQSRHRNRDGGFWIAEAVPEAAQHALTATASATDVPWLVVATDGAYKPMVHLGLDEWPTVAAVTRTNLVLLLDELESWESDVDPHGTHFPRAKRHDDKAIATVELDPRLGVGD